MWDIVKGRRGDSFVVVEDWLRLLPNRKVSGGSFRCRHHQQGAVSFHRHNILKSTEARHFTTSQIQTKNILQ